MTKLDPTFIIRVDRMKKDKSVGKEKKMVVQAIPNEIWRKEDQIERKLRFKLRNGENILRMAIALPHEKVEQKEIDIEDCREEWERIQDLKEQNGFKRTPFETPYNRSLDLIKNGIL